MVLAKSSFGSGIYPYTITIPLMSACLIYLERSRIFARMRSNIGIGVSLSLVALSLYLFLEWHAVGLTPTNALPLVILSFVLLWVGVFVACYGTHALRAAGFQVAILLLMVPLPQALLERLIFFLRGCSAQAAAVILKVFGVPVFQNGSRLSLPGIDVEVAEECSGIRSGLALLITGLLMGHLFLRSPWRRFCLVLAILPVTIYKNGLRIVTIYLLTVHSSMESLTLWVHHYGGIPFSFLGLSIMACLVISLRKFEESSRGRNGILDRAPGFQKPTSARTLDLTC